MPRAHGLGHRSVANENGIDRRSQEPLDERGRVGVCAHEIAKRAEYCAFAENAALLEQPRCGGRQADALSLQPLERVELRAQSRVQLVGAQQLRTRRALALTRLMLRVTRVVGGAGRLRDAYRRDRGRIFRRRQVPARGFGRVEKVRLLSLERRSPHGELVTLPLRALVVEIGAVQLFAQLAEHPLTLLEIEARSAETGAHLFLSARVSAQSLVGGLEGSSELRELCRRTLQLAAHTTRNRVTFAALLLGALATGHGVPQSLFGHRDFAPERLGALALVRDQSRQLCAAGFAARPLAQRRVA